MHKAKGVVEREKKEMETVEGAKRTSQSGEMVRGDKKRIQTQKRLFSKQTNTANHNSAYSRINLFRLFSSAKYNSNLVCALTYDDPLLAGTAVTRFRCRGCYGQQASQSRHGRNVVLLSHHTTPSVCALSLGSGGPRDRHRAEPPAAHILLRHGHVPSAAAFLDRQPLARLSSHRLGLTRPAPTCRG